MTVLQFELTSSLVIAGESLRLQPGLGAMEFPLDLPDKFHLVMGDDFGRNIKENMIQHGGV